MRQIIKSISEQLKDSPIFYDSEEKVVAVAKKVETCEVGSFFFSEVAHLKSLRNKNVFRSFYTEISDTSSEMSIAIAYISSKARPSFNNQSNKGMQSILAHNAFNLFSGRIGNIFSSRVYSAYALSADRYLIIVPIQCNGDSIIIPPQGIGFNESVFNLAEFQNYLSKQENLQLIPLVEGLQVIAKKVRPPERIRRLQFFCETDSVYNLIKNAKIGTYVLGNYEYLKSCLTKSEYMSGNDAVENLGMMYVSDKQNMNFKNKLPLSRYSESINVDLSLIWPTSEYLVEHLPNNKFLILMQIEYKKDELISGGKLRVKGHLIIPGIYSDELCDFPKYLEYMTEVENLEFSPLVSPEVLSLKDIIKFNIFSKKIAYKDDNAAKKLSSDLIAELDNCSYNPIFKTCRST